MPNVNSLEVITKLVSFTKGTLTRVTNISNNYSIPLEDVKKIYLESINEYIQSVPGKKQTEQDILKMYSGFGSNEWREIWHVFTKKIQDRVSEEGGARKGQITRLTNQAKKIVENDIRRLRIMIGKRNSRLQKEGLTRLEKAEIKEELERFKRYLEYLSLEKTISTVANKLKVNPNLTSFVFKE